MSQYRFEWAYDKEIFFLKNKKERFVLSQVRARQPEGRPIDVAPNKTSSNTSTTSGTEVRRKTPGFSGAFGLQGWAAGACMTGGSGCMAVSGYMPTLEGRGSCLATGFLTNLIGLTVCGRTYYVARLAKSLAESIVELKRTENDLRGLVEALHGKVQDLRAAVEGVRAVKSDLDEGVVTLRVENESLRESNASLTQQLEQGRCNIEEQSRVLALGAEQLATNIQLIKQREAQSQSAGESLRHFEGLLGKAESGFKNKQEEFDEVAAKLEQVSADLEEQLEAVRQAREELEIRIPQLEQAAIERVQGEAEILREKAVADVTLQLDQMRISGREAAREEAHEIRNRVRLEVKEHRAEFENERKLHEDNIQARSKVLIQGQESIQREREQVGILRATLEKREAEILEHLAHVQGDTSA